MPSPNPDSHNPPETPFLLALQRLDETLSGNFRPGALVQITPLLRTSRLLFDLPGEELRTLLLVLTFAHPNGSVQPTLVELAQALRQSQGRTRTRMQKLERLRWQGRPVLHELRRESGLHAYAPSPRILGTEQAPPGGQALLSSQPPTYVAANREAVIAHSRAMYARPREEVEEEIARLNGWPWPVRSFAETQEMLRQQALSQANAPPGESGSRTHAPNISQPITTNPMSTKPTQETEGQAVNLSLRLQSLGIPRDTAESLVQRFDPDRIERQIRWLPFRKASRPDRLLIAAIEADYEAPMAGNPALESPAAAAETATLRLP